jgi:tetraacyldisaccharide 4'-kinase
LREPPSSVARAQLVVLTRVREGDLASGAMHAVRSAGYSGPIVRAGHRTTGFTDAAGAAVAPPLRALAFCGIGDPGLFRDGLAEAGVATAAFRAFRDHQPYSVTGWDALVEEATSLGVPLVTTEKDLSRLEAVAGESLSRARIFVLRIEAVAWDETLLLESLRHAVSARRSTSP